MSDERTDQDGKGPQARFRPSRWPGLVWAVPGAALLIVAWIGIRALAHNGPQVQVTFPLLGGVKTQHTKVKYHGAIVGHVSTVRIYPIRDQMKVDIRFDSDMAGYLGRGTKFWIVGHSVHATSLASLKTLVTGPYIAIDPVAGKTWHKFVGAAKPPILKHRHRGQTFVLVTKRLDAITRGAKVYYRHVPVGAILGYRMTSARGPFHIYAFIRAPYDHFVRTTSTFWNASALHVALGGRGPAVQLQSLPALVSGAVAFMTPERGRPVPGGAHFMLYRSRADAREAPSPVAVRYQIIMPGGPHGLKKDAPVSLGGMRVGSVIEVKMRYHPKARRLRTRVLVALDPRLLGLGHGTARAAPPVAQVNAMLRALISQGLRAERARSAPLIGAPGIVLARVGHHSTRGLKAGEPPIIPFTAAGGAAEVVRQVSAILAKLRALPLQAIAANIRVATGKLAALSQSPRTAQTLVHLQKSLANVQAVTETARHNLPGILRRVRAAARAAEAAVHGLRGVMTQGGNPGPQASSLPAALHQVAAAARSLRTLTNYLDEHPNALLVGKDR